MNNATLAINVARPAAPATQPGAPAGTDAPPAKRFDVAMDAAHADARKPKDTHDDKHTTSTAAAAPDAKTPASKEETKPAGDLAKKDEETGTGDTSVAAAMLALIGVPPKAVDAGAKALGALKNAAGKAGDAIGALATGVPAAGSVAEGVAAAAKDGMLSPLATAGAIATVDPTVTASPFGALLAAQGAAVPGAKDEALDAADAANASPMPFAHAQHIAVDGPAVQLQASQPVTSPQFAQELGEQIAWMGSGEVKEARIKLHPEELGSMDIRVSMDGGKVNVAIIAQHPAAVHAVQQTLSQLDTLLAHHGLSLGQADVGQRDAGQDTTGEGGQGGQGAAGDDGGLVTGAVALSPVSRGLVDEVA